MVSSITSAAATRQLFKSADTDASGGLGLAEFKKLSALGDAGVRRALASGGTAAQAFSAMDGDGNGSLTKKELAAGLQALTPDVSSVLLAAQENLNAALSLSSSQASSLYGGLLQGAANSSGTGGVAANVLAAYYAGK